MLFFLVACATPEESFVRAIAEATCDPEYRECAGFAAPADDCVAVAESAYERELTRQCGEDGADPDDLDACLDFWLHYYSCDNIDENGQPIDYVPAECESYC